MKGARKLKIKNLPKDRGITLIELIVVIFIIALFSTIVISDFPKIQRQYALSNATYKLAQDLRKTQDLGLSGVQITDGNGTPIPLKGYGIYVNVSSSPAEEYVIYADVDGDQKYSGDPNYPLCSKADQSSGPLQSDCVVDIVDVSKQNSTLYISGITDANGNKLSITGISINFMPPNPTINIEDYSQNSYPAIGIVLGLKSESASRTVKVNTSGLISVQ